MAEVFDPWADLDAAHEEAQSSGSFKPLPGGARDFDLYEAEVVPYSKKEGSAYAGLFALSVQLKVPDGAEYANRRLFDRVPLFPKSPPNEKGESYVQYNFFNFFEKALGFSQDQLKALAGALRSGQDISGILRPYLGKRINATLKVTPADEYNPEGDNKVTRYAAASGASTTRSTVATDAWASASSTTAPTTTQKPVTDVWATTPAENPELAAALAGSDKSF